MSILAGVIALTVSFLIADTFGARQTWTREKAEQYTQAGLQAKSLAHRRSHGESISKEEIDKAMHDYEQLNAELLQAQRGGNGVRFVLRWGGVTLTALGLLTIRFHGRR